MNPLIDRLSKDTGLAPKELQEKTGNPLLTRLYKDTKDPSVFNGGQRTGVLSPLDISASTIDLTNTYTDPLEDYRSYGVPLNPFVDWNEERAKRQSTLEKWGHGLTKAGITGLTAITENTVGLVAGLANMAFGDNHSFYDNPVGRALDDINEWAREAMPNYYTKAEERASVVGDGWGSGLLSANFWADKVAGGAAYTLGSIASMFLGTGEAALIGRLGNMGKASKFTKVLDVAADAEKALEKGSRTLNNYRTAKIVTGRVGMSADEVAKGIASLSRRANITTGAKNFTVAMQMSLAEANMEARETKNRFIEEQTAKWEEANPGQEMPEDVKKGIEESGYAAGNLTFGVNMAILAPTNVLMFGKMFTAGKPVGESLINPIEKQGTGLGAKWIESQGATKFGRVLSKSNRMFGAPVKNMLTESFQEGSQFLASETSRLYYDDKFSDGIGDMVGSFSKGLSKTFGSKEGIENMLIGALIGGGSGTISRLFGAEKKLLQERAGNTTKALEILNSKGFAGVLQNMENTEINRKIVDEMDKAVKAGDMITADRFRMRLIANVANQYRKVGALDAAMEQLEDLKLLDEKEFISRWGYDTTKTLKEQTGKTQIELVDEVKKKIETYSKIKEGIETVLRAQVPEKQILPRVVDSLFETKEVKESKALELAVREMYGNQLLNRVVDLDSIDDNINKIYDELVELSPELGVLSKEDFNFNLKVGNISIDKDGKFTLSPSDKKLSTSKAEEKFIDIINAYKSLNRPDIAAEMVSKFSNLQALMQARESAMTSYERFTASPADLAESVIADILDAPRKAREQANETANQALQNAQSSEELINAFPPNTDADLYLDAMAKIEEFERQEAPYVEAFTNMTDEEFSGVDPESLSPIEEAAYNKSTRIRAEKAAALKQSKNIEFEAPEAPPAIGYQEALNDIEARTFGEIMVSPDGGSVNIDGKTYHNLERDNPLDAILRDEFGNITGFTLTDLSTGNKITWKINEVPVNPETGEVDPEYALTQRENAIVEGLAYMTLLQAASIRADQTIPLADAKEELAPRIEAIKAEVDVREKFETNEGATEAERDLAVKNLDKTAGLTDIQLRAQIETLKEDLAELNDIIAIEEQIAREAGFTKKETDQDPSIKELKEIRKRIKELLNRKITALRNRKQTARNQVLPNSKTEAELTAPTPEETDFITAGLNEEIRRYEDQLIPLNKEAEAYQDIINGKYEGQNVQAAAEALGKVKRKIAGIKAQITKRNNQINRINEERELEKLRQERDNSEGPSPVTEGQEPEAKDIDARTASEEKRVDGVLAEKEAEKLRQQREEAARKLQEEQEKKRAEEAPNTAPSVVQTSTAPTIVVRNEGETDVQLVKGEVATNPEFKVVVSDQGLSMSGDNVRQTVDGKIIPTQPDIITRPDLVTPGSVIRFEVREDTDYWTNIIASKEFKSEEERQAWMQEEGWKTVPIFAVYTDPSGKEIRFLLQATNETNGTSRQDIYSLHSQGLTPVATVEKKLFDGTNVRNSRVLTPTGEQVFFYPASILGGSQTVDGQPVPSTPQIVYVGSGKYGVGQEWKTMNPSDTSVDPETHFPLANEDSLTKGQIGVVVRRPDGTYGVVVASTRDMTEAGKEAAIHALTKEEPSMFDFSMIVGVNTLMNQAAVTDQNESDVVSLLDDDAVGEVNQFLDSFIMMESLVTGAQLLTFYSESAKELVRLNSSELKAMLLGSKSFRFSFVTPVANQDGRLQMTVVSKENKEVYKGVAENLKADFEKLLMKKKFQVSKEKLANDTAPFISPIDGQQFSSYFEFLTSDKALGTPREGASGTKAILAVDTSTNMHGSVFYDVGLKFSPLGTLEGNTTTQRTLDVNSVPLPKTQPAPTAPVSDEIADIERRRKLSKIVELDTGVSDDEIGAKQPEPGVQVTYYLPKGKTTDGRNISEIPSGSIERYTTEIRVFYGFEEAEQQAKEWIDGKYNEELAALGQPTTKEQQTIEYKGNSYTVSIENGNGVIRNSKGETISGTSTVGSAVLNKVDWENLQETKPTTPAVTQPAAVEPPVNIAPISEDDVFEIPTGSNEGSAIFALMGMGTQTPPSPPSDVEEGAKEGSVVDLGDFLNRFRVKPGQNPITQEEANTAINSSVSPDVQNSVGKELKNKCIVKGN